MGAPMWDAQKQEEYVRQRDGSIARLADERDGKALARDIDATWALLAADEQRLLEYLVLSGARSCIGRCSDPLLSGLVARGLLSLPRGVRTVLTDDLETVFRLAPALSAAIATRQGSLLRSAAERTRLLDEAAATFGKRVTPIAAGDSPEPYPDLA